MPFWYCFALTCWLYLLQEDRHLLFTRFLWRVLVRCFRSHWLKAMACYLGDHEILVKEEILIAICTYTRLMCLICFCIWIQPRDLIFLRYSSDMPSLCSTPWNYSSGHEFQSPTSTGTAIKPRHTVYIYGCIGGPCYTCCSLWGTSIPQHRKTGLLHTGTLPKRAMFYAISLCCLARNWNNNFRTTNSIPGRTPIGIFHLDPNISTEVLPGA